MSLASRCCCSMPRCMSHPPLPRSRKHIITRLQMTLMHESIHSSAAHTSRRFHMFRTSCHMGCSLVLKRSSHRFSDLHARRASQYQVNMRQLGDAASASMHTCVPLFSPYFVITIISRQLQAAVQDAYIQNLLFSCQGLACTNMPTISWRTNGLQSLTQHQATSRFSTRVSRAHDGMAAQTHCQCESIRLACTDYDRSRHTSQSQC